MSGLAQPGPVALLTSAGREPVRALALALATRGWRLALNDLTPQRLDETAAMAHAIGAQVSTHIGDASKGLFARGLVEEALDAWGQIDVLFNCPLAAPRLALLDLDEWDFQRTLEANIHGPFLLMQLVGNWMRSERHPGVMVNLITAPLAAPTQGGSEAFYASQMGLRGLTAAAAPGLEADQIDVYGVCTEHCPPDALAAQVLAWLTAEPRFPSGTIFQL